MRNDFDLPILGLILPGARAAVGKGKRIGVIATTATVKSEAYVRAICESDPQAQVFQVDCPEFVPLIESDRINDPYTLQVAKEYLQPLIEANIDTLVLGCTHYPPFVWGFTPNFAVSCSSSESCFLCGEGCEPRVRFDGAKMLG